MVSDSDLIARLREFLRNSDLETTTTGTVRRKLEEDFGIDLSDKKAFIREQVDLFLQTELENNPDGGENQDEDDRNQVKEEDVQDEEEEEEAEAEEESGSGNEQEEDDEYQDSSNVKSKRKKRSIKKNNEVRKRGGGFTKLCALSPKLQEFIGVPEMARTEVVKQLWAYIREKDLQDPNNRRNIICDEALQSIFGVKSINMFAMNKVLSKHIWPLDSDDVIQSKPAQKEKQAKHERDEDSDEPKKKEKRQKGGKSGFLAPLRLSEALVKFLGTGESELSRADTVKRMWDYIKENNLQDPSDRRVIRCDDKLKELFDVDTFHGFTVSKLLAPHFVKTE